jgi:hypothetical protein
VEVVEVEQVQVLVAQLVSPPAYMARGKHRVQFRL